MKIPCTKHRLTRMSAKGDEVLCEWDTATISDTELAKIESEFNQKVKEGYFAADLQSNEIIKNFDSNTDILLLPRMAGGCD